METKINYLNLPYLDHKIIDEITHHIIFDKHCNLFKIGVIDYLSIYSNRLLIRSMHTGKVIFQGEEIETIILECRCDLRELKNFINYLLN